MRNATVTITAVIIFGFLAGLALTLFGALSKPRTGAKIAALIIGVLLLLIAVGALASVLTFTGWSG